MNHEMVQNLHNKLIIDKAREMGIECKPLFLGCEDFLELSYQGKKKLINKTRSHKLTLVAGLLAKNKDASNFLLRSVGLPIPEYRVVSEMSDEVVRFLNTYKVVAVKPLDAQCSVGVTLGIETEDQLIQAIQLAASHSDRVIVQKYIAGYDYRVLVIDGRIEGVLEYQPPILKEMVLQPSSS